MPGPRRSSRPNLLFVLVDDQGYGDFSCHGHPRLRTPELDRLWRQSVRLTDFHVSPMCAPSRGSLLTGLDPLRHGAMNVSSGRAILRPGIPTLADVLRADGYRTGIFGKWHLGDSYPYRPQDRGFDEAIWFPSSHITGAADWWHNDYFDTWLRTDDGDVRQFDGYCTDMLFDHALRWVEDRVGEQQPFFAFIPLNAVHRPLLVEEKYRSRYGELDHDLATYFGMIDNIDENIGRLDAALHRLGIWDETIVVYMSDNGPGQFAAEFYNAGMRGWKTQLWDGGHRVPCFIRWPGGGIGATDGGRDVDEMTAAQDFMPTVLDLCGLDASELAFDGVSLAAVLRGEAGALTDRKVVVQFSRMESPRPAKGDAAVLWGKWRLVEHEQLYHVGDDPAQNADVADQHPDVVAEMQRHYDVWWRGVEASANEFCDLVVGDEAENPVLLTPADWRDSFLDRISQVREGLRRNGTWGVTVARPGRYQIELRRWPAESGLAIRAPAPEFAGGDRVFPGGRALDIQGAGVRFGDVERATVVGEGDLAARFELDLEQGSTMLWTWFEDGTGQELCGAYYAYIERVTNAR